VAHHRLDPDPADLVARLRVHKRLDLTDHDPAETFGWSKEPAKAALPAQLAAVADLQKRLFAEGARSVLVVLQAIDAGGKDGTLREVFTGVNPSGVSVRSFGVPSEEELAHDYLWRVHQHAPADGQIGVFNRSHYEDVLVVRVKHLVPEKVWKKRFGHITAFEQMLVDEGTAVVKVFLNLSKDEQRERFQDRIDSPDERWKFRRGDLDDRALWDDYQRAFHEMMVRTSTPSAPWYVVPADRKWVRNLCVAAILRHTLEQIDPQYPEAEQGIEGVVVE
jgi:PPK2 family polyphosphate:nucleotide phosphotransferase